MLLIKYQLKQSSIYGIGLFSTESINENTVIWQPDPTTSRLYKPESFLSLSALLQKFIKHYGYFNSNNNC